LKEWKKGRKKKREIDTTIPRNKDKKTKTLQRKTKK
jgi:hypothetical protein